MTRFAEASVRGHRGAFETRRPGWAYDVSVRGFTPDTDLGPHRDFLAVTLEPGPHSVALAATGERPERIWLCAPLDVAEQ